jgi:hypothetical protein
MLISFLNGFFRGIKADNSLSRLLVILQCWQVNCTEVNQVFSGGFQVGIGDLGREGEGVLDLSESRVLFNK